MPQATEKLQLPGDTPAAQLDEMIRVNHAGEYGAKRIYQGQLAAIKDGAARADIQHMLDQELAHLTYFEDQIAARQVRPSLLMPLWHGMGFGLGWLTARLGTKSAMACTVAVETQISDHYQDQIDGLSDNQAEADLRQKITTFRAEELEHHDHGLEAGADKAPLSGLMRKLIGLGARTAITIAKKI